MPNQPSQPAPPTPVEITPALLKTHSITDEEYASIEQKLGRTPSLTELGIFSVMWSEHCSYKSSRVHLKRLPTKGTRTSGPGAVLQGPGENAGIIDVGDGWACAFKIESHNHPSYIEPYQGAATGVGGILRDIFTMGARPMAVMDSLRFGPLKPATSPGAPGLASETRDGAATAPDYARNRQTMRGVVHGVGGYGNCFGVPNLGGETRFEECYSGNPFLNAFALGLVRTDEIFYAKAEGVGNPVFYVGAKTGRDGIHGATMASEEFTAGSEQKRPNVQMGDPFLEKLLLEACLEVMKTGAVLGIQDMGAAGLTCSTCEMGARGELGVTIELDRVPQRETGMTSYEIMLSESQERMLLVAEKGRESEVLAVFEKWGLDCAEVGTVTADDVMRVYHGGVLQAEIPNKALTDEAPLYHRPVGTWTAPVPKDPPAWVLEELKKPRDYTADLLKLLASPNICSKHWVYEQYDSMVQTNTVQGPGGEAGVIRIKGTGTGAGVSVGAGGLSPLTKPPTEAGFSPNEASKSHSFLETLTDLIAESTPQGEAAIQAQSGQASRAPGLKPLSSENEFSGLKPTAPTGNAQSTPKPERGLAMALAGNGRWCYLDPKLGAMHAVAEAARKVACTGATPVAATNCLNFGNPQKPEIMAQLSQAIDGISEACNALGTPVTGGNVSLYNETLGEGIYPTPVIGVVGILDDVTKAVPSAFQRAGEIVLEIFGTGLQPTQDAREAAFLRVVGNSEFARSTFGAEWGEVVDLDLSHEAARNRLLAELASKNLITSATDVGSGGVAVCLAKAAISKDVGVCFGTIAVDDVGLPDPMDALSLFVEHCSVIVTCAPEHQKTIEIAAQELGLVATRNGITIAEKKMQLMAMNNVPVIEVSLDVLRRSFAGSLESQLNDEVLA